MNFKQFLASKGISEEDFAKYTVEQMAKLHAEFNAKMFGDLQTQIKEFKDKGQDVSVLQKKLEDYIEANKEISAETVKNLKETVKNLGLEVTKFKENGGGLSPHNQIKSQINEFISGNIDKIKEIHSSKSGVVEFTAKAPALMTTGAATNPNGIPAIAGVQMAQPGMINLRATFVEALTSTVNTSLAAYPYTETIPKDGDYDFVAEGAVKPQIDFAIETHYAQPSKIAAWIKLTDESVQDIPGLQSIANDLLRKKHDLKRQNAILFGDGTANQPLGATNVARTFVAGAMALSVVNPNIMDVINAVVTDVYTTQNYSDEESYMPSLVVINPIDFFLEFVSKKDGDGKPLYPTASLFNRVNIGGITIIPERTIPTGKIFVADMSKYNTTNYVGYTVKIGWVNDDFIKNQFVILGESRFHAFVKNLDEQAFVYDDIATVKTAITAA